MLLLGLLLLVGAVALASGAATITARSPVLFIENGKLLQNQTVTIRCDGQATTQTTTFQNTRDGVARTVTVTCHPPRYVYELQLLGHVPRTGRLFEYQSCTHNDPAAINNASNSLSNRLIPSQSDFENAGGGTGRRLLTHTIGYRLPDEYNSVDGTLTGIYIQGEGKYNEAKFGKQVNFRDAVSHCYNDQGCALGFAAANEGKNFSNLLLACPNLKEDCANRLAQRSKERAVAAAEDDRKAFTEYMASARDWQGNITKRLQELSGQDEELRVAIETSRNITRNLTDILRMGLDEANLNFMNRSNITLKLFQNLRDETQTKLNEVKVNQERDRDRLLRDLNSLSATLQGALVNHTTTVFTAITNLTEAFNERLKTSETRINKAFGRQLSENRNIYRVIRTIETAFRTEVERRQFQIDLVKRLRIGLLTVIESGLDPFLPDIGVSPPLDQLTNSAITLESVRMAYIQSGTAYNQDYSLVCDTRYIVKSMQAAMTWFELLTRVGPPNCFTNTSGSCACYIRLRHKQCTVRSGGESSFTWVNDLSLDNTVCTVGTTISAPDTVFTSPDTFMIHMRSLCGLTSGVSYTLGAFYLARRYTFLNTGDYCDMQEDELEMVHDNASPVVGILGFWEIGMANVISAYDTAFDYVHGVLPNLLMVREDPFWRIGGQTGRCVTMGFVATSKDWLPVYRVAPVTAEATVTVQEEDGPLVEISNADLTTNFAAVLPSAEYIVIGDPRVNTTVYDVPLEEISLAPTEYARRGKVTYLFFPLGETRTATRWTALNGAPPQHDAATNFAEAYVASIDPLTNECVVTLFNDEYSAQRPLSASLGSWCAMRSLYSVQPARDNSTRLEFIPRSGSSFTVQATLSQGELTQELVSVCPVVTILPQGAGTLILMDNPRSTAARVLLVAVATGGSSACSVSAPVDLVAGASTSYFVPRCVDASAHRLTIFRLENGDVVAGACVGASDVDIRSSALTYSATYGNVGAAYVNFTQAVSSDQTLALLQQVEVTIATRMAALLSGILDNEKFIGLPLSTTFFESFRNATNATLSGPAFPPFEERPAINIKLDLAEFIALSAAYRDTAARNQAAYEAAREVQNEALARAAAGQAAGEESQMRLRNVTSVLELRTQLYVDAHLKQIDTQIEWMSALTIQARASQSSGGGGLSLGGLETVGGFIGTVAKGAALAIKEGAEFVVDLAEAIVEKALDELNKILGVFSSFAALLGSFVATLVVSVVLSTVMAYRVHSWARNRELKEQQGITQQQQQQQRKAGMEGRPLLRYKRTRGFSVQE